MTHRSTPANRNDAATTKPYTYHGHKPGPATWAHLEQVIRDQITRAVANALMAGVPSVGIMNQATKQIMATALDVARAEPGGT